MSNLVCSYFFLRTLAHRLARVVKPAALSLAAVRYVATLHWLKVSGEAPETFASTAILTAMGNSTMQSFDLRTIFGTSRKAAGRL